VSASSVEIALHAMRRLNLNVSEANLEMMARVLAKRIERDFMRPLLPPSDDSLAVTITSPKTAALAFDRVYRIPHAQDAVPSELGFYGASIGELNTWAFTLAAWAAREIGLWTPELHSLLEKVDASPDARTALRELAESVSSVVGRQPTPLYKDSGARDKEFPPGPQLLVLAAISDMALVDEAAITWQQVVEFREDYDAVTKYRRLVRWVDAELATRSAAEVQDEIALRLDDYDFAVRKHGLQARLGALSSILDPRFLGASSAAVAASALAASPFWAILAGTVLTVGKAAVTFKTAQLDGEVDLRKTNEVAYVYEVREQLGQ
jgi:hypothetical protein